MDSKTYNKDVRKTCVEAVFDEFAEHGDMIRPQYAEQWDEIDANRSLGHITGPMDIDVPDLVDVIIDTIVKEAHKRPSQLLDPPKPPIIIPYGDTPYALRLTPDGGTELMQLNATGHTTLATLKPSQAETFAYHLQDAIGATR